jgi:hypothetical protein
MDIKEIIQEAVDQISDDEEPRENWLFSIIERCVYDCMNAFNKDDGKGE